MQGNKKQCAGMKGKVEARIEPEEAAPLTTREI